jgi:hypothetical protein
MKGRKKHKAEGGPTGGADEAEEDIKTRSPKRSYTGTNAPDSGSEAEELKKGGRAKKKRGGGAGKTVGVVEGPEPPVHAGRKPRKGGGRATSGSESHPFTSANKGTAPKGHKTGGSSKNPLEGMNENA